jgi:hypothetical protein
MGNMVNVQLGNWFMSKLQSQNIDNCFNDTVNEITNYTIN